jgi:hypothetical protein
MVTNPVAEGGQITLKITNKTCVGKSGVHFASMLDERSGHKPEDCI